MNTGVVSGESIQPLYSIGYGSRTFQDFVQALLAHRIEYVIDVRSAPYSKFKPEFSKEALQAALKRLGFHYVYMGDQLGGQPADPGCYADGKVDYAAVRTKPFFHAGLERLRTVSKDRLRAVILCSEERPEQCHRSKLIGEALAALGIPVRHIDEKGLLRSQAEVIDRLTGGQLELFGNPEFTSRKRYESGK
jgi:uncharacterized protein (DUF488 family)